jgi:hypothetical protein
MHGSFQKRITINLTTDQHERLTRAAAAAGIQLAPYLRSAALAYLDKRFAVPPRLDDLLARLIQETRRVGTNVNQVAARVNAARVATPRDVGDVALVLRELEGTARVLQVVLHNLSPDP